MRAIRLLMPFVTAIAVSTGTAIAAGSATSVRLILPVEEVRPGESFLAGLELTMSEGWHTYWRNGGDSGAPTSLDWQLPAGMSAGAILWPPPERYEDAGLVTYVYHGTVTLLVPVHVAADAPLGNVQLVATAKWLECEKLCLPGRATVEAPLRIGDQTRPSPAANVISAAKARIPDGIPPDSASAYWDGPPDGQERAILIHWQPPSQGGIADFFPFRGDGFEVLTGTERLPSTGGTVLLRKKVRQIEDPWPQQISGLLVLSGPGSTPSYAGEAVLDIAASAPASTLPPAPAPAITSGQAGPLRERPALPTLSLASAIGLGILGGIILNIMPCVLPVIALKVLGFVRQSGSRPAEVRKLGLVYGLGVWFSFLVLAGVVIGVKRAVGVASWGMQFGNPIFLVSITTLVLLVALSLFGVFEINLTGRAMDHAGDLASREGTAGAFFNGMLAVALATPCTAPFLAPALGYAFTQTPAAIIVVFSAVALGLAAPYVILSWHPAWLRFLPKPGRWMARFKVAMGFPMLATALWLYSLAAARFGDAGALWLGVFLVGISLAAWIWGEFVQRGGSRHNVAIAAALVVAAGSYAVALEGELNWRSPALEPSAAAAQPPARAGEIPWERWSAEAVAAARSEGRPVLVDFTADWCLTCKVNERSSLNIAAVRKKLEEINGVALKADHTRLPADISRELQRFNRAGVPLVLVYPRDPARDPIVLPEVLTPGLVLDALEEATM
jgi:thiol:disulfide interchange protein DsbD